MPPPPPPLPPQLVIPVVALDEAEAKGCDGLGCKNEHAGMFGGQPCTKVTPTPPTTPLPDPTDDAPDDKPAPLICGGGKTADTRIGNVCGSSVDSQL